MNDWNWDSLLWLLHQCNKSTTVLGTPQREKLFFLAKPSPLQHCYEHRIHEQVLNIVGRLSGADLGTWNNVYLIKPTTRKSNKAGDDHFSVSVLTALELRSVEIAQFAIKISLVSQVTHLVSHWWRRKGALSFLGGQEHTSRQGPLRMFAKCYSRGCKRAERCSSELKSRIWPKKAWTRRVKEVVCEKN